MSPFLFLRVSARLRRRGIPARVSSLAMVFQRSPLVQFLPEARILSTSGFTETVKWTVTAIAGLGAFDSISGASQMIQLKPTEGSLTVNGVAGDPLNFTFQTLETPHTPGGYQTTPLPPGLTLTGAVNNSIDSITGIPSHAGTYPVTITAREFWSPTLGLTGDSFSQAFTFEIVNPPLPEITVPPTGGNFPAGAFVSVSADQNHGRTFTWTRNGAAIPEHETLFCPRSAARKFRAAPANDPGPAWRNGEPFVESTDTLSQTDPAWTTVSGGIGYDTNAATGGDFVPHIFPVKGNLQALMFGDATPPNPVAIHLRMPFTLSNPETLCHLTLRVQCDDGFVAWLNGTEIASQNKPEPFEWNSGASAEVTGTSPVNFRRIDVSQHLGLLRQGENLLAVQAMNGSPNSPDFLFNCELAGGVNTTNSPYLALTNLQPSIAGSYALTVTNPAGSVTSDPVPLLVVPSILTHPESVTIEHGATAQLTVVPDGSPPFFYQWYSGLSGDTSSLISGATEPNYTSPALTETAHYWVRLMTAAGTADSNTATVTVNPPPDPYSVWKAALFSAEEAGNPAISGPAADPDADGLTNEQEYVFGTLPQQSEAAPAPAIAVNGNQIEVTFTARKATGPGYAGRTRHYAVQTTGDLVTGPWTSLPEAADIAGNDQPVTVVLPPSSGQTFCRLKVWLTP